MKTTIEVTDIIPNEKWAAKVIKGPVPYEASMSFAEVPEGTRVTMYVEAEPKGFFKLAEGMVTSGLEKNLGEGLDRLKSVLEST